MHNVDVNPNGWERIIDEAVQNKIQLNTIDDEDWYETKFELIKKQPDRFVRLTIEDDQLFYYRPNYKKAVMSVRTRRWIGFVRIITGRECRWM